MDVIGFDLVEVNPMLDVPTGITSYLAAHDRPVTSAKSALSRDGSLDGRQEDHHPQPPPIEKTLSHDNWPGSLGSADPPAVRRPRTHDVGGRRRARITRWLRPWDFVEDADAMLLGAPPSPEGTRNRQEAGPPPTPSAWPFRTTRLTAPTTTSTWLTCGAGRRRRTRKRNGCRR